MISTSNYLSAVCRVSAKAAIRNDQNEILVIKEHTDQWRLPGGGIDHDELISPVLGRQKAKTIESDKTSA